MIDADAGAGAGAGVDVGVGAGAGAVSLLVPVVDAVVQRHCARRRQGRLADRRVVNDYQGL